MFIASILTLAVEALQAAFDDAHPDEAMRGLPANVEYPLDEASYPGFYVNFVTSGDMRNVGIGHVEYAESPTGFREIYRWSFSGILEITIAALSNLERARMIDELATTIAFGRAGVNARGDFRQVLEHNDLIGLNVLWEAFTIGGFAETPGTPWQTDDVIYEATASLTIEGEVVFDPATGELMPLAEIRILERREDEPDTTTPSTGWL